MHEYRLHDPEKGVIGPVRLETVRDLVNAGVAHEGMWVSRDGGPFLPIAAFSEIVLTQVESEQEPKPTYSGDLGKNTFFKVFFRFHATRATGLLRVDSGETCKNVYLTQGQPTFVTSNIPEERLGEFLRSTGRINENELKVAVESMHTDDHHLGYTLIRLGILEPPELFQALREQQTARLVDLCKWESGRYRYFDGQKFEGDVVKLQLVVPDLIIEAARQLPVEKLDKRLHAHMDAPIEPQSKCTWSLDQLRFSPFERRVADRIDGKTTLRQLLEGADEQERRRSVLMVVYLLWEIDALSFQTS